MIHIFVDESGSMKNPPSHPTNRFFFMPFLVLNEKKAKKMRIKKRRYVSKNMKKLKRENEITKNKHPKRDDSALMFYKEKFKELKGSCLSFSTKRDIVSDVFLSNDLGKNSLFLIKVINGATHPNFFTDVELAFNFIMKCSLKRLAKDLSWSEQVVHIHIDNRNIANTSIDGLEAYLNKELTIKGGSIKEINVSYHDSEKNDLIQIIDLVANLHFSSAFDSRCKQLLEDLEKNDCVIRNYQFPAYY